MPTAGDETDKRRTVVFHIGRHKTGTSSIQTTLKTNAELLGERGFLYPNCLNKNHSGFFVNAFSRAPEGHPNNRRYNKSREEIQRAAAAKLEKIEAEASNFDGDIIVFSGEDASTGLNGQEVRAMKDVFDTLLRPEQYRVILYTRHPVDRVRSSMQQAVKGNGMTLEDSKRSHLANSRVTYRQIFENYAEPFGESAVEFRSFEKAARGDGGLVGDFFHCLRISDEGIQEHRENERLSEEVTRFLSWLYDIPADIKNEIKIVRNRKMRVSLSESDREALYSLCSNADQLLSLQEKLEIWNNAREDMAFLADVFGIHYEKPDSANEPDPQIFDDKFLAQLADDLPRLTEPVRIEMLRFLLSHS